MSGRTFLQLQFVDLRRLRKVAKRFVVPLSPDHSKMALVKKNRCNIKCRLKGLLRYYFRVDTFLHFTTNKRAEVLVNGKVLKEGTTIDLKDRDRLRS